MTQIIHGVCWALLLSIIYFSLITDAALSEDVLIYYSRFSIENFDPANFFSYIYKILIGEIDEGIVISFSDINLFSYIFFGTFNFLLFEIFVFVIIFFLIFFIFLLVSSVSNIPYCKMFFIFLSLPMAVNLHFVWRQFLGEILILAALYSSLKFKTIYLTAITLFVHPLSLMAVNARFFFGPRFFVAKMFLVILVSGIFGYFIGNFSTISSAAEEGEFLNFKMLFWLLILLAYLYPVIKVSINVGWTSSNLLIFLPFFLFYLANTHSLVGISRLVSFQSIVCVVYTLSHTRRFDNYFSFIGPSVYVTYQLSRLLD